MYKVEEVTNRTFEFEWDGETFSVASASMLSADDVLSLADASAKGNVEQTRWLVNWFAEQTDGATRKMPIGRFSGLARKWYSEGNLGKSQASSD